MQRHSGSTAKGVVTVSLMTINVIAWCTVLFIVALLKLVVAVVFLLYREFTRSKRP